MHFLAAHFGAHAANSRHAGGAAVLEDVSHGSDDECRARVERVRAIASKPTSRASLKAHSVTNLLAATTPFLPVKAVGHRSVVASMISGYGSGTPWQGWVPLQQKRGGGVWRMAV